MIFTDWEGPWVLTDFAFELANAIFNNPRFFSNLSVYDDYLAYEKKKRGYEAGYTLKLLVPFFVAFEIRNKDVEEIAKSLTFFVRDAKISMDFIQRNWKVAVISTSYNQFLKISASKLGFRGFLHGTEIDFDSIEINDELKEELKNSIDLIASLRDEELYKYLDELFERREIKEILDKVKVIGAGEKAKILKYYCKLFDVDFPIAIGDSISDYKMFKTARKLGGIAIAFNGNKYALENADIAIVSDSAIAEAVVIYVLNKYGVNALKDLNQRIPEELKEIYKKSNTKVYLLENSDFEMVLKESQNMRVKLRGSAGMLG